MKPTTLDIAVAKAMAKRKDLFYIEPVQPTMNWATGTMKEHSGFYQWNAGGPDYQGNSVFCGDGFFSPHDSPDVAFGIMEQMQVNVGYADGAYACIYGPDDDGMGEVIKGYGEGPNAIVAVCRAFVQATLDADDPLLAELGLPEPDDVEALPASLRIAHNFIEQGDVANVMAEHFRAVNSGGMFRLGSGPLLVIHDEMTAGDQPRLLAPPHLPMGVDPDPGLHCKLDDDEAVAEWAGQHYGINFEACSEYAKYEWRRRYPGTSAGAHGQEAAEPVCDHEWNQTMEEADESGTRIYCLKCGQDGDA